MSGYFLQFSFLSFLLTSCFHFSFPLLLLTVFSFSFSSLSPNTPSVYFSSSAPSCFLSISIQTALLQLFLILVLPLLSPVCLLLSAFSSFLPYTLLTQSPHLCPLSSSLFFFGSNNFVLSSSFWIFLCPLFFLLGHLNCNRHPVLSSSCFPPFIAPLTNSRSKMHHCDNKVFTGIISSGFSLFLCLSGDWQTNVTKLRYGNIQLG